jgi:hypothetical protein
MIFELAEMLLRTNYKMCDLTVYVGDTYTFHQLIFSDGFFSDHLSDLVEDVFANVLKVPPESQCTGIYTG